MQLLCIDLLDDYQCSIPHNRVFFSNQVNLIQIDILSSKFIAVDAMLVVSLIFLKLYFINFNRFYNDPYINGGYVL